MYLFFTRMFVTLYVTKIKPFLFVCLFVHNRIEFPQEIHGISHRLSTCTALLIKQLPLQKVHVPEVLMLVSSSPG